MSNSDKHIVMIGPSLNSKGGIASVVSGYEKAGLFDKWPIVYIATHVEGSKVQKARVALLALLKFIKLVFFNKVKLVHIHVPRRNAFWRKSIFILFSYLAKCPVLIHLHSGGFSDFYWNECGFIGKLFVRIVLNKADRLIVLSSQWWQILDGITVNTRLVKIPNFIQLSDDDFKDIKREPNTLLFLGRLIDEKGFFELLSAIKLVKVRFHNIKLLCGGEGNLEIVQASIERLGIVNNVELLGWVNDEKKDHLLKCASVFILPSYIEGFPMVILEAMSKAVPVIATEVGGIPDIIESGKDGFLVKSGDIAAIADAIILLLDNASNRKHIGDAGRNKVADQFTVQKVLPMLENVYREFGVIPC